MKRLLILLPLLSLACQKPTVTVQRVEVPIPVKCKELIPPAKSRLPISTLSKNSTKDDVIQAYIATVDLLQGHIKAMEIIIKAHNEK